MTKPSKYVQILELLSVYGTAFFSLSLQQSMTFVVPLWALTMNASPVLIGLSTSVSAVLPALLSISYGSIIDRLSPKKTIFISAPILIALSLLHPVFPFIGVLILFQLLYGQFQAMSWISAQTHITKTYGVSSPRILNLFALFSNVGTFLGPLLMGILWEFYGAWGAFLGLAGWAACLWFFSSLITNNRMNDDGTFTLNERAEWSNLLPQWNDYKKTLAILSIPAIVIVVIATFLRLVGFGIRGSFYVVYLEQIAPNAIVISLLFSLCPFFSIFSPLITNWLLKFFDDRKLLIFSALMCIIPFAVTPLFTKIWVLGLLSIVGGTFLGLTLPLMMRIVSSSVQPEVQGLAIGLREMANRWSAAITPFIFGLLVASIGLNISFFAIGLLAVIPTMLVMPFLLRRDREYRMQNSSKVVL